MLLEVGAEVFQGARQRFHRARRERAVGVADAADEAGVRLERGDILAAAAARLELTQQLVDAADYQGAIRRYNEAMQSKPTYIEITPDVARIREVLELNSRPVNITFLSDSRTWVSITNFRMLGKIQQETVALPPGDYEVVGRRKNYRDVLLTLRVRPQMSTNQVSVVCNVRADS